MPSPLAHLGIALALARTTPLSYRDTARILFASIAPDLDVLPMLWDEQGVRWHHGPTHSIVGALLIGSLVAWKSAVPWRIRLSTLLHLPLDWSTGRPEDAARFGIPWFWPFSSQKYIDPHPFFGAFGIDQPAGLWAMLDPTTLVLYGKELMVALLALGLAEGWRRWKH